MDAKIHIFLWNHYIVAPMILLLYILLLFLKLKDVIDCTRANKAPFLGFGFSQ